MSEYKHKTDRVDGVIIAECSECSEYSGVVEYESAVDDDVLADLKDMISDECHHCGGEVGIIQQETPTEVLR